MLTLAISSCDENTVMMGNSLTDQSDKFTIVTDTFAVGTRSSLLCLLTLSMSLHVLSSPTLFSHAVPTVIWGV